MPCRFTGSNYCHRVFFCQVIWGERITPRLRIGHDWRMISSSLVLEVRPLHKKEKLKSLRTSTSWLRLGGLDDWLRDKIPSRQKGTIEISGMNESINLDSYQVAVVMRGIPGSLATKIEMSWKSFWLDVLRKFHQIFYVYPWYVWNVSWVWDGLSFLNDDSHKNLPNLTNKTGMKTDPIDFTHSSLIAKFNFI